MDIIGILPQIVVTGHLIATLALARIHQKPKKGCPVIGRDPAMSGSIYTLFLPYMYGYKTYQIPIGIYTCPVFFIIEFMDTYINPDNDSHKIERTKMSYGEVLI